MERVEASGRTVEDALRKALAKLGADRDEVEFVVLDEGRRGLFFGRGARDAVVRVERVKGRGRAPARESRGSERGGPRDRGERGRGRRRRGRREGGEAERPSQPRGRGLEQATPRLTEEDFFTNRAAAEERAPSGRRGEGGPPAQRGGARRQRRERDDAPYVEPDINAEEVDFAATVVDDLLQILDINADISIREPVTAGDGLGQALAVIDISGDDLGFLIGRRGESLLALQYIVNLILARQYPDRGAVTIDVEHYRHRREEQIVALAERMAERVRATGLPITLEPMTPAERRLVHLSLADEEGITTTSVGEGANRKVVINIEER